VTGTGLTRYHNLPYPPSQRVRGNGASDIEALAVKTDTELDTLGANWNVVYKPDSAIYTLSSLVTGVLPNSLFTGFNFNTTASWGAHPPGTTGPSISGGLEPYGWYSVTASLACIPSGAVTASSRRALVVNVYGDTGSGTPIESYMREDYEAGGVETILEVDFVTFLGPRFSVAMTFIHANTGSNMNILTQSTFIAFNRLIGTT